MVNAADPEIPEKWARPVWTGKTETRESPEAKVLPVPPVPVEPVAVKVNGSK